MALQGIGTQVGGGPGGRGGIVVATQRLPGDRVALRIRAAEAGPAGPAPTVPPAPTASPIESAAAGRAAPSIARTPDQLDPGERAVVDRLRQRDAQVRQEEQAHAGAAGALAGPIAYVYEYGPDGRAYAVGGSVAVNLGKAAATPEQGRRAAAALAAAAHAATNPSAADLAAAAKAYASAAPAPESAGATTVTGRQLYRTA